MKKDYEYVINFKDKAFYIDDVKQVLRYDPDWSRFVKELYIKGHTDKKVHYMNFTFSVNSCYDDVTTYIKNYIKMLLDQEDDHERVSYKCYEFIETIKEYGINVYAEESYIEKLSIGHSVNTPSDDEYYYVLVEWHDMEFNIKMPSDWFYLSKVWDILVTVGIPSILVEECKKALLRVEEVINKVKQQQGGSL